MRPSNDGSWSGHDNPLQHAFSRIVRRMRFAREDDLDGTARIGQQAAQPLGVAE